MVILLKKLENIVHVFLINKCISKGDLGGRYQNENMSSSHRSVRTNGGRYEEEEHFSSSNGPDDSENRQFRPIFQPVFTEQSSKTQKWPNSNKQHNIV